MRLFLRGLFIFFIIMLTFGCAQRESFDSLAGEQDPIITAVSEPSSSELIIKIQHSPDVSFMLIAQDSHGMRLWYNPGHEARTSRIAYKWKRFREMTEYYRGEMITVYIEDIHGKQSNREVFEVR